VDNNREDLRRARTWSPKVREETGPLPTGADPELEQFGKESAEFNARVHQALAEIPVPPNLREQILARSKIIPVRGWRRQRPLLAIAAAFVLLGALAILFLRPAPEDRTFTGFRSRMVAFAIRQYSMDIHTNQFAAVQSYLARTGAPADFPLPTALANSPVMGGAKLSWQGKPVGMVCFAAKTGQTLYMFVIDSADIPGAPAAFDLAPQKSLATAAWHSAGKTFLIAGDVPLEELEKLVKS
jgi:hypothetical protein